MDGKQSDMDTKDDGFETISAVIDAALKDVAMTKQVNVAIDGMCGSGKSTLGKALAEKYGCNLFHTDDFFLRPEQRTPERYAQPGGNVDYERFREEVLEHLADQEGLAYRRFDCHTMALEEPRTASWNRLNIIEGAYSCHPYFGDVYQLRFFMEISSGEQKKRIEARNGAEMYRRFEREWIPMENRYFEACEIRKKCIVVNGD